MLYWDGDFEEARELWQDVLERSAAVGDSAAHARALTWLGLAAFRLGEYAEAKTLGEKALALKLRLGLAEDLPKSYNALGLLALSQGRLSEAGGHPTQRAPSAIGRLSPKPPTTWVSCTATWESSSAHALDSSRACGRPASSKMP
jgi:tetratricopeptide (TPR) repeat protein